MKEFKAFFWRMRFPEKVALCSQSLAGCLFILSHSIILTPSSQNNKTTYSKSRSLLKKTLRKGGRDPLQPAHQRMKFIVNKFALHFQSLIKRSIYMGSFSKQRSTLLLMPGEMAPNQSLKYAGRQALLDRNTT